VHIHLQGCAVKDDRWTRLGNEFLYFQRELDFDMHAFNDYAAANDMIVIYPKV